MKWDNMFVYTDGGNNPVKAFGASPVCAALFALLASCQGKLTVVEAYSAVASLFLIKNPFSTAGKYRMRAYLAKVSRRLRPVSTRGVCMQALDASRRPHEQMKIKFSIQ